MWVRLHQHEKMVLHGFQREELSLEQWNVEKWVGSLSGGMLSYEWQELEKKGDDTSPLVLLVQYGPGKAKS